jgi:quercetin dioxygenase-like cupin family protein
MSAGATPQPATTDPARVDAKHYGVEYEDERVRVLRVAYGPGEKSTMHTHPALVAIMLTDAKIRMTYADGTSEVVDGKAGQVMQMPAVEHLPENVGDKRFEAVLVELKG